MQIIHRYIIKHKYIKKNLPKLGKNVCETHQLIKICVLVLLTSLTCAWVLIAGQLDVIFLDFWTQDSAGDL